MYEEERTRSKNENDDTVNIHTLRSELAYLLTYDLLMMIDGLLNYDYLSTKTHCIESGFVTLGPDSILFAGQCVHFSSRKFDWLGQWRG